MAVCQANPTEKSIVVSGAGAEAELRRIAPLYGKGQAILSDGKGIFFVAEGWLFRCIPSA